MGITKEVIKRKKKEEGKKLCENCMIEFNNSCSEYGLNPLFAKYFLHCHHSESIGPEKPTCKWCKEWRELKLTYHGTPFWHKLNYLINFSELEIEECPNCGKKI